MSFQNKYVVSHETVPLLFFPWTGLEAEGVVASKPTHFAIFTAGAGKGKPEVVVLDPNGRKDTVPAKISPGEDDTFRRAFLHAFLRSCFVSLSTFLKRQCQEIFYFRFSTWISFPQAPDYTIRETDSWKKPEAKNLVTLSL